MAHRAVHLKITCYLLNLVFLFTLTLNTYLDLMISFQFISTVASGQLLFMSFLFFQFVHSGESVHLLTAALWIHISRTIQVLKIFQVISCCMCKRDLSVTDISFQAARSLGESTASNCSRHKLTKHFLSIK